MSPSFLILGSSKSKFLAMPVTIIQEETIQEYCIGCFQIQLSTAVFVATGNLRRDQSFHVEQHLYYLNIFKFISLNLITLGSGAAEEP